MSDTEIAGKTGTRSQKIIRTSIVGIAANVLLAAFGVFSLGGLFY